MIAGAVRNLFENALGERVRFDVALSRHTSLRVGGPAAAVASPADRDELAATLAICTTHGIRHALLGAGFNAIAPDTGFDGIVIRLNSWRRIERVGNDTIAAEAGVSHAQISNFCIEHGLAGLEFASGIPGSVGGWIAMNAGIPDREMKDAVETVEIMAPDGEDVRTWRLAALDFGYRSLRAPEPGSVILSARFDVTPSSPDEVKRRIDQYLARRTASQPLHAPSCGSVFKNPPDDHAGRLIESVGLKGHAIGGAEISRIHANFIMNTGRATASDVMALIEEAQRRVLETTGIRLVPEVRILGSYA
jgi:UDP-N-acetylmuramate dehydrogenase